MPRSPCLSLPSRDLFSCIALAIVNVVCSKGMLTITVSRWLADDIFLINKVTSLGQEQGTDADEFIDNFGKGK